MRFTDVQDVIEIIWDWKFPYVLSPSTTYKKDGSKVYGYITGFESEADDPDGYGSIDIDLSPIGGTWVNFPDIDYIEYDDKELEYVKTLTKDQARKRRQDKLIELSNKK